MNCISCSDSELNPNFRAFQNYPWLWRLEEEENSDEADEMERLKEEQKRKEEEEKEKDLILA